MSTTRNASFTLSPTDGSQPVQLHETHKHRHDAQIVEHWRPLGLDHFRFTATWTTSHAHYQPAADDSPGLPLVAETLRQAVISICHAAYDVPADQAFVMQSLSVELGPGAPTMDDLGEVEVDLKCHDIQQSNGALRAMEVALEFVHSDLPFGRGTGSLVLLPAAAYRRIRGDRDTVEHRTPGERVAPASAGCRTRDDVLIAQHEESGLRLAVDTTHRWHFDHAADHLPGMLLIEAAVQSHSLHTGRSQPRGVHATFTKYAEIKPDVTVTTKVDGSQTTVDFHQCGERIAEVAVFTR